MVKEIVIEEGSSVVTKDASAKVDWRKCIYNEAKVRLITYLNYCVSTIESLVFEEEAVTFTDNVVRMLNSSISDISEMYCVPEEYLDTSLSEVKRTLDQLEYTKKLISDRVMPIMMGVGCGDQKLCKAFVDGIDGYLLVINTLDNQLSVIAHSLICCDG